MDLVAELRLQLGKGFRSGAVTGVIDGGAKGKFGGDSGDEFRWFRFFQSGIVQVKATDYHVSGVVGTLFKAFENIDNTVMRAACNEDSFAFFTNNKVLLMLEGI